MPEDVRGQGGPRPDGGGARWYGGRAAGTGPGARIGSGADDLGAQEGVALGLGGGEPGVGDDRLEVPDPANRQKLTAPNLAWIPTKTRRRELRMAWALTSLTAGSGW